MAVIGVMIEGQEGLTWDRWRNLCRVVEDLGFESLWRSDHFFSVMGEYQRDCIETWVSLALCAEWTKRITFGPNVSPMTFRPPAVLAKMAASVDILSGGRLVLGSDIPRPRAMRKRDRRRASARGDLCLTPTRSRVFNQTALQRRFDGDR